MRDTLAAAWIGLYRRLQIIWLHVCQPDLAVFLCQLQDAGMRRAHTALPSDTEAAAVRAWFQNRIAITDRATMPLCVLYRVPSGVDSTTRGWRQDAVELGVWCGYPHDWECEGATALIGCLPAPSADWLLLTMLYFVPVPDDDDANDAGGGVPHVAACSAAPLVWYD